MSGHSLDLKVNVTLRRQDGNYSLIFKDAQGREAMCDLGTCVTSDGHGVVLRGWAEDQMLRAYRENRRSTHLLDRDKKLIREGDILFVEYNDSYPIAPAVVKWSEAKAAFVLAGSLASGGAWESVNLEQARKHVVVGNMLTNPELLRPAKFKDTGAMFPAMRNSIA